VLCDAIQPQNKIPKLGWRAAAAGLKPLAATRPFENDLKTQQKLRRIRKGIHLKPKNKPTTHISREEEENETEFKTCLPSPEAFHPKSPSGHILSRPSRPASQGFGSAICMGPLLSHFAKLRVEHCANRYCELECGRFQSSRVNSNNRSNSHKNLFFDCTNGFGK